MDLSQRPPYDTVDFRALAKKDDDFKQSWQKAAGRLDFQDPHTVQVLSKAILKVDFGLQLDVPSDRLCPPVPNRWNYVSWIQNLIDSTSPSYSNKYDPKATITGLDIGTGASAIYTMLCLQSRRNWRMCATDIDKKSFSSAARNLALNNLLTRTALLQTLSTDSLIPLKALAIPHIDFTICNPPFFSSTAEMASSLSGTSKSHAPSTVCTGSENEMVCPGGDVAFVTRILHESLVLREQVSWYTSLLGKLSSLKTIIALLKSHNITNFAVGVIDTGGSTRRWVVGWSFGDLRPRNAVARMERIANECLPFPTAYEIKLLPDVGPGQARERLDGALWGLDLKWVWDECATVGVVEARGNVWGRAYRRAFERKKKEGVVGMEEDGDVQLVVRIRVVELARELVLEWVKGRDQVLWESFCGTVHRLFKKGG
ncbi:hypothetical protein ACN47E_003508 [Coniothyrium glycines]